MNDLDLLKDLRRATPEITPAAAAAARDRLRAEWTEPARGPRRAVPRGWSPPRLATRAVLAGALGLALAVGIGVAQNTGDPRHGVRPGTSIANAAVLGERAARAVENTPFTMPRPDQWIYHKGQSAQFRGDMNTWWLGMDTRRMNTWEDWERVDGQGSAQFVGGRLQVRTPGRREDLSGDLVGYKAPGPDMYRVIKELPTEPGALLRALYDPDTLRVPDNPDAPKNVPRAVRVKPDDRSVFGTITDLLQRPLPPKLRAALYRALPRIPGVSVQTDATDAAGRHGTAFTNTFEGWVREMIILAPATYRYLGTRSYAVRDHVAQGEGTVKKGSVLQLTAQLDMRVVGKPGARH
ncbi:CU044_5270 family protein [Actinomadura rugatobispora]|uniref:CU044_5270 family protein n=1 Tax=Actinomadura rugatobispora TaxID=1994 RepID=A0ABW0ZTA1_9ACTN|nr:hypothetical protein GCM10010200_081240 [Actinomadura rugatobispora]